MVKNEGILRKGVAENHIKCDVPDRFLNTNVFGCLSPLNQRRQCIVAKEKCVNRNATCCT